MSPVVLTLYSRPGCHLCEEMKETVAPVARQLGCTVTQVDISGDPELERRYATEIPVLLINGRKAFKYRLTERELRRRLRAEEGEG
ncbi:MAG TPA: glutaredoxin family protein [Candidatus Margulisiibacteriota bacterium]|nr:glutaredoxin family protein [Candidatus Margulisiibacteriota bacterium]